MKEIIKRFKRLNKDSKKYLQGRKKLEERYKYLSLISPLPKEKNIEEKIFLVNKDAHILVPYQFENVYHKGQVELKCKVFNPFGQTLQKVSFNSLSLDELKRCIEIDFEEVQERISKSKNKMIEMFDCETDYLTKSEETNRKK